MNDEEYDGDILSGVWLLTASSDSSRILPFDGHHMSEGIMSVEKLDRFTITFSPVIDRVDWQVLARTVEGSTILVQPMPWGIVLDGFRGYSDDQKSTWTLTRSTFRRSLQLLCLFIPSQLSAGGASVPLIEVPNDEKSLLRLDTFVISARAILGRSLPDGVTDDV